MYGELKRQAARLDDHGRNGDTLVAHINPKEAMVLALLGGAATHNPKTGLLEFYDGSTNDTDSGRADGSTPGQNDGLGGGMAAGGTDPMGDAYGYGYGLG